ncbi:MAG: hypothetical protein NUV35_09740, partial [Syntrophomonadaceae bacterium]|nr:hypothetical protein [Syntrophomonadaceae bacterium]
MSIRTRTLAGMAAVFVASAVILAALARPLLLDGFTAIEQREIQQDVERGLALYRAQLGELDRLAADWGAWDQAYAFASCPSQDFLARNVTESALANLHASMMAYLPDEDPAVYGLALDPTRQALRPMPSPLRAALLDPAHGLRLTWPGDRAQGLLVLPEGPMLVAARPVLTGAGQGPSRGTVVVGRYLDDALQEGMAASSGLPLRFLPAQQLLQDPAFARQLLADSRHHQRVPGV